MDFNAYLASSSDEEDSQLDNENSNEKQESSEDEDEKIDKYKVGFCAFTHGESRMSTEKSEREPRKNSLK